MPKVPFNETFKKQQKMFTPAAFKRATISSVNPNSRTANVYFSENPQTVVKNIPIANGIDVNNLVAGMQVRVDTYNETSTTSMVIAYVFGQSLTQSTLQPFPVPANSSSSGSPGQVSWDATHFYICTALNSWGRVTLSSF